MNYCYNKRAYPDWCRIYHNPETGAESQFESDMDREQQTCVIYEGPCVKYGSSQMRKFVKNSTIKADHCVDIPHVLKGIMSGYRIDVRDAQGEWHDIEIVVAFADTVGRLGTTVFFNIAFN